MTDLSPAAQAALTDHPVTPPPALVATWCREADDNEPMFLQVATRAAQWGADQELQACCEWLKVQETRSDKWFDPRHNACALVGDLRSARRPEPPSLKEQALEELDAAILRGDCFSTSTAKDIIRRALESIPDPS